MLVNQSTQMEPSLEVPGLRINRKRSSSDSGCDNSEDAPSVSLPNACEDLSVLPEPSTSSDQKNGSFKRRKTNRGQLASRTTKQNTGGPKELRMNLSKVQDEEIFAAKLQKIAKTYYDQNKLLHQDFSESREKINKWWDVMEDMELENDLTTKAVIQKLKKSYNRRCQPGWTKKKEEEFVEAQEKKLQNKINEKCDQIQKINDITTQTIAELRNALSEEKDKSTTLSATIQKLSEENNTLIAAKRSMKTEKTKLVTQIEKLSKKNSDLSEINKLVVGLNFHLTKKVDENNEKLAKYRQKLEDDREKLEDDRQKLEDDREKMLGQIELKNRKLENELEALAAAKREFKVEQEEFETKMKDDQEKLTKQRADLKAEAMLLYEKAKAVYAKTISLEEGKFNYDQTELEEYDQQKLVFQHRMKHSRFKTKAREVVNENEQLSGLVMGQASFEEETNFIATEVDLFEESINQLEIERWNSGEKEVLMPLDNNEYFN